MQSQSRLMMGLLGALFFAACSEIDQDARKPFAGEDETRSYAGPLRERAKTQDEYLVMPNDARPEAAQSQ